MGCAPAGANRGSWTKQFNARREPRNPETRHKARLIVENRQKLGLPPFLNWSYFASPVVSDGCYPAIRGSTEDGMCVSNRVVIDSELHHGRPVIRGTRLPVTIVVGSLAGGMSFAEVEREYDITADDIRDALRFVMELAQGSFHPLPAA